MDRKDHSVEKVHPCEMRAGAEAQSREQRAPRSLLQTLPGMATGGLSPSELLA